MYFQAIKRRGIGGEEMTPAESVDSIDCQVVTTDIFQPATYLHCVR